MRKIGSDGKRKVQLDRGLIGAGAFDTSGAKRFGVELSEFLRSVSLA